MNVWVTPLTILNDSSITARTSAQLCNKVTRLGTRSRTCGVRMSPWLSQPCGHPTARTYIQWIIAFGWSCTSCMQFTSAKNHWILPTHSNVTSKIVELFFTLRGPPCRSWPSKKCTKEFFDRRHRWEENLTFYKTFKRKQTCRKQTSFNIQLIFGCRQYGHRFKVTRDISPTISGWLLLLVLYCWQYSLS